MFISSERKQTKPNPLSLSQCLSYELHGKLLGHETANTPCLGACGCRRCSDKVKIDRINPIYLELSATLEMMGGLKDALSFL